MKKISLFVTVIVVFAQLLVATPAAAGTNIPVGDQIRIRNLSIEFPANTPFHIRHGWIQPSSDSAIGVFDFALEVDGIFQREDYKGFTAASGEPDLLSRIWVYNFPAGMTGTHTFTGHWYAPCQYAVDNLGYLDPCPTPNLKVETSTRSLIVTFVP